MTKTTQEKLTHTRKMIRLWESKLRRAANKLAAYRAVETRQAKRHAKEIADSAKSKARRAFDLE